MHLSRGRPQSVCSHKRNVPSQYARSIPVHDAGRCSSRSISSFNSNNNTPRFVPRIIAAPPVHFSPTILRRPFQQRHFTSDQTPPPPSDSSTTSSPPPKTTEQNRKREIIPPPPGISLVINVNDKRFDDLGLGVRAFIITSIEAAKRFPVQVEAATWPGERPGRCDKCEGVVSPCVVTTHPLASAKEGVAATAVAAQEQVWSSYPLALDGVMCRSCSTLTAPRFVTPEEFQRLAKIGLDEAKARNFALAEYFLRRCANAYPEYLYARLNLGSLFMDRLSVEESSQNREEVRTALLSVVRKNFEACLLPDTKPPNRVPGKVYTTLARIYLSERDPLRAVKIMQRLLAALEKATKADDKEALAALDFSRTEDTTYAQSLMSKALAGLQLAAIEAIRSFAYYGDAEAKQLSPKEHAMLSAAVDTLNLVMHYLRQPTEKYGYLLNVDRYALFYFLAKALQVLGDRKQAAGWFLEALKNANTKERRIEAVTEYAGDFLHCRQRGEAKEHVEKTIALLNETKEQCGDPDGNIGSSLGMLYLAIGAVVKAEQVLESCATETGASLARGLLTYLPAAKKGGSEEWRWEKSGNRLYITTGDEQKTGSTTSTTPTPKKTSEK